MRLMCFEFLLLFPQVFLKDELWLSPHGGKFFLMYHLYRLMFCFRRKFSRWLVSRGVHFIELNYGKIPYGYKLTFLI